MFKKVILLGLSLLISACHQTAVEPNPEAEHIHSTNEWEKSLEPSRLALADAYTSQSGASKKAVLHYEYGRALGVTCSYKEAEENLKKAYDYDRASSQPLYLSLIELGRLNYVQQKFKEANDYFSESIKEFKKSKIDKAAPMDFVEILSEQSETLQKLGRQADVAILTKQIAAIKKKYPNDIVGSDRTPYGKYCPQSPGAKPQD